MMVKQLERLLKFCALADVPPPYYVAVSLLGIDQARLRAEGCIAPVRHAAPTELLCRPELIESFDASPAKTLEPIFNALWNAWGLRECSFCGEKTEEE